MSDYTGTHARALNLITRKGVGVSCSEGNTSVNGFAVQDTGSFREFLAQGLVTSGEEIVFFVPSTVGECPKEGYVLSGFTDIDFAIKRVFPIALNGTVIAAKLVLSR